jgi:hypothetical protein
MTTLKDVFRDMLRDAIEQVDICREDDDYLSTDEQMIEDVISQILEDYGK